MTKNVGGRPKGVQCKHIEKRYEAHCRKSAKVRILMEVSGGTGVRRLSTTRCWVHYVYMENTARKSNAIKIISARILRSER